MSTTDHQSPAPVPVNKRHIMNGGTALNGSSINGTSLNGSINGTLLNGSSINGTSLNGSINGTLLNGSSINGTSLNGNTTTDTSVNSTTLKAAYMNGSSKNGTSSLPNGTSVEGPSGCVDTAGGELLKAVLEMVLKAKLVTGLNVQDKVVEFKHPKELKELLDLSIEEAGCSMEVAREVLSQTVRYSVKTQHPYFCNQLFGGIDEVALTGAWMTEALNTSQYTFEVAPVFMMVEHQVLSWLFSLFGFQDGDGIFSPGGSLSNMYGMILARYRQQPNVKRVGVFGQKPLVAFTSDQGHYSVSKSAAWLGIGMDNVVAVPSDARGKMLPGALREEVAAARARGATPFFVNATAGTTILGAYDSLPDLADVCQEEGLWLHVDACWGGAVILSEKHKHLLDGIHRADSLSWNPHKMLGVSLQCSTFLTRHKGLLHQCNSARATYLFQQDKYYDLNYDTGDKSVQCGRKVDAFKFWVFLKLHGLAKLRARVDQTFAASRYLSEQVSAREGFRLLQEPECTNVCFWFIPPSMRGQPESPEWWVKLSKVPPKIKERMVKAGTLMVGYQPMACKNLVNFFRMVNTCIPVPTLADMDHVIQEIERLGADL